LLGCAAQRGDTSTPSAPRREMTAGSAPSKAETKATYVSTADDSEPATRESVSEQLAVTSAQGEDVQATAGSLTKIREQAGAAVSMYTDDGRTWQASPVLPTAWPPRAKEVMLLYYPLEAIPTTLSRFDLFSPAYAVTVSLVDGSARVKTVTGKRRLGKVNEKPRSMLERNELEIAEQSLVARVLGNKDTSGENDFWGYLKYFREHPAFARDIAKRAPKFVAWLSRQR